MANIVDPNERRPWNSETQNPEYKDPRLDVTTIACSRECEILLTGKDEEKGKVIPQIGEILSSQLQEGVEIQAEGPQGETKPEIVEPHNR